MQHLLELKLDDIPICSLEALDALANEAPPPPKTVQPSGKRPGRRGSRKSDLGPLELDKYLTNYGIEYTTKTDAGKTIFKLRQCLFDPGHGKNEASIIQDAGGKLTYQCFHNSCKGRTWADARAKISGDASLAEFCDGYDPTRTPTPARQPALNKDSAQPWLSISEKGRVSFNPALFATHLANLFHPLINEGGPEQFFHFNGEGLWKTIPEAAIMQAASQILKEDAKSQRLNDSLNLLRFNTYQPPEKAEPDPLWLNLKNCMYHVETGETRPHAASFNSRVQLPVAFDPDAQCTGWTSSLVEIFSDDPDKIFTVQDFFGYCLYPRILFPCAIFCIGKGSNGKGVVQHVLESMLGKDNVCHISLQRMEDKWGPVELRYKLLNACAETSEKSLDTTRFKEIAAGDLVQAERKFLGDVIYRPIAKHLISMNNWPGIKDKSDAFFRRVVVLEFNEQFLGDEADTSLKDKLLTQLNGIFRWSLEGLKRVLEHKKITTPESVTQAKHRLRSFVDPIINFADECCLFDKDAKVLPPDLYRAWIKWCEESGIRNPVGKLRLYEAIQKQFHVKRGREHGAKQEHFSGIGLRGDDQLPLSS
jgi:P4 family phage/plasmid primase-like protien